MFEKDGILFQKLFHDRSRSVSRKNEAMECLSSLREKYVVVPENKIVCVCKSCYNECIENEIGKQLHSGNLTYINISFDNDSIL